ncbi:MAG: RluA family pseudouridine synthase [Eubacteriales bacterium]|nr:RluA family pseudouridine synthase [Eubacteriales bacterium]
MIHKHITVSESAKTQRLIPVLIAAVPGLSASQVYRALRKKDIRLNGKRLQADQTVAVGDVIDLYLADTDQDIASSTGEGDSANAVVNRVRTDKLPFQVVFRDSRIMILNKEAGITVHGGGPDASPESEASTLIALARNYFGDPNLTLCHRLDRNTGGLIILAHTALYQQEIEKLMKDGLLSKRYHCLVRGEPIAGQAVRSEDNHKFWQLDSFLEKRAVQSEVYIHNDQRPGDLTVTTRYRILKRFPEFGPDYEAVSELEVELVTGRTHQIRAHLAHFGHPILGDGKYGRNAYNRFFKTRTGGTLKYQQLFACQLNFSPRISKGPLADLAGKTFQIEPDYDLDLPK